MTYKDSIEKIVHMAPIGYTSYIPYTAYVAYFDDIACIACIKNSPEIVM